MATASLFTPAFLTPLLQAAGLLQRAVVNTVTATPLAGQATFNAQLYRLHLHYDLPEADAPTTLVAKLPTADALLRERASVFQPGQKEVWFYRQGAASTPVAVPRCYYAAIDKLSGESMLLLEDLAPAHPGNQVQGASPAEAHLALQALASLHAAWWGKNATEVAGLELPVSDPQQAHDLVGELYSQAWPLLLERASFAIPRPVIEFGECLLTHLDAIEQLLDAGPVTLLHGDFRLENMLFGRRRGEALCWIIDWEDISFGNAMADVAWFLGGSLPLQHTQDEEMLLRAYHTALAHLGVEGYSWAQCYDEYRYAMCSAFVQGVLMATPRQPGNAHAAQLGQAVGERFIQACQRLRLHELIIQ